MEFVLNTIVGFLLHNAECFIVKSIKLVRLNGWRRSSMDHFVKNELEVLHVSKHFLVVNKPFDLVINNNDITSQASLQMQLRRLFPELVNPKLPHDFYFIHRLDFATSGVICLGLNKNACAAATSSFETRKTKKYYLAVLRGHVKENLMDITAPIGEDVSEQSGNHRMCVATNTNCFKPRIAYTKLLVLQRGHYDHSPATKVILRPVTGRRHQLRVHCSSIGHTIVGDFTYSNRKDIQPYRTFLHSYRLIVPNSIELIDVKTSDPFTQQRGAPDWEPLELVNALDDGVFSKLDD